MLNYFTIYLVGVRKASIQQGYFLCIKNSYCYSGLNHINGMQNLNIINIFSCIRLIVNMLELDNYTTKQEHRGTPYKLITG